MTRNNAKLKAHLSGEGTRTQDHGLLNMPLTEISPASAGPQELLNGQVHDWYRIVHGYSDHLVSGLLSEFSIGRNDLVLDPFCGTGTTMVECMKKSISSVGVDANPASCFAARVKTNWQLSTAVICRCIKDLQTGFRNSIRSARDHKEDPTYQYLETFGFIKRGWISEEPLRKVIIGKRCIRGLSAGEPYQNLFMLALMNVLVNNASNVKFGPEIYCSSRKTDANVLEDVVERIKQMCLELSIVSTLDPPHFSTVVQGDARDCGRAVRPHQRHKFAAVICSPPYPTEHDYTRNSRLELALLEEVTGLESLRKIKKQMVRSHTKNIYKTDDDAKLVSSIPAIERIAQSLDRKAIGKESGFVRYYPFVVREYFGGMYRHFRSVAGLLKKDARCAYVVGDQCSYLNVFIPTAELLAVVAEKAGFEVVETRLWRTRKSTTGTRRIDENILVLRLSKGEDRHA